VGAQALINSHKEVSEPDVLSANWDPGGAISLKDQPNACRLGNEALDEGMVASNRSTLSFNFSICESRIPICPEVSTFGERGMPGWKPEISQNQTIQEQKMKEKQKGFIISSNSPFPSKFPENWSDVFSQKRSSWNAPSLNSYGKSFKSAESLQDNIAPEKKKKKVYPCPQASSLFQNKKFL
jgi:hypothetical protein